MTSMASAHPPELWVSRAKAVTEAVLMLSTFRADLGSLRSIEDALIMDAAEFSAIYSAIELAYVDYLYFGAERPRRETWTVTEIE